MLKSVTLSFAPLYKIDYLGNVKPSNIHHFSSIAQLMRESGYAPPLHPLIALVDYNKVPPATFEGGTKVTLDFYKISFKNTFTGQVKYGQGHYGFENGGLAFLKPKQMVVTKTAVDSQEGMVLYFHRDLVRNYPLGKAIHGYGFFDYAVSEALSLSAAEKELVAKVFAIIAAELSGDIDKFSGQVLVSQIELLLNYSLRFYDRQFLTRKTTGHDIISALDRLLTEHFLHADGLPVVQDISKQLAVSQRYLSDMLRSLTGHNTQAYIQHKIVERSKDLLSSTTLSVAEIAYELGFGHPQSFSKLFKAKTDLSPLQFRRSFD
ncbi:AraC family transcriptional regulator [Chitinophaga sedimenti]|uniref:helix-turn-helix domain-containing protein n=1 Tax=Chitinophaga sedimenti TaxID=2033606 RepID=UPI0020066B63|nr:AraC family transcriptional regulator [Chitinophaga sedimenti]MCK7554944.1 AraC family transcriptional regulator [Chitinophaga sedimenti]